MKFNWISKAKLNKGDCFGI